MSKDRALLWPTQGDVSALLVDLEWPEDPKAHQVVGALRHDGSVRAPHLL
jgi:hypothetical protein